jgi:lipopolysaccharide transport system ATP-binding protein
MGKFAIRVQNLGKRYKLGSARPGQETLRHVLTEASKARFRKTSSRSHNSRNAEDFFWALKDISFEAEHGEILGIVGKNGAGKTTLLKVLARITKPTIGFAEIHGRVGSLLEVGTGFHNELTGRENVFLNGAILGIKRTDMLRRFDDIVDFAEVHQFIDVPVKHYSSGMRMRLAFAVAAYLEPEILLVDEVLAVGDAAFQKKCLGKMNEVSRSGRTVLFVSHNMTVVSALSNRGLLIESGVLKLTAEIDEVIGAYRDSFESLITIPLDERTDRRGNGEIQFTQLTISDAENAESLLSSGCEANFRVRCSSTGLQSYRNVIVDLVIRDHHNRPLFSCSTRFEQTRLDEFVNTADIVCSIPKLPLCPGTYHVDLWCGVGKEEFDYVQNAGQFEVFESDFFRTGHLPVARKHGPLLVEHSWRVDWYRRQDNPDLSLSPSSTIDEVSPQPLHKKRTIDV